MSAEELARRAVAAAEGHGLDTVRLECCARGYGVETGPWMGELLALVREAWVGWVIEVIVSEVGASVRVTDINGVGSRRFAGSTLAPCLVGALEAAP